MNKIKQLITTRRVSLLLILGIAGLMYVSRLIPQEIDSTPEIIAAWRRVHTGLIWLVDACNLHKIYSQPWFAGIILFAALAIGVSSYDQVIISRKKLSATGTGSSEEVAAGISEQRLCSVARSHRYRVVNSGSDGKLKFVRSPWGYFGNPLLHIGMALVIAVSLYVALTFSQGVLILVEGERRESGHPWNMSEHGLLATPLKLPGAVRLDRVRLKYDDKQQPVEVVSEISIGDASGRVETLTASINRILRYRGMRIYHSAQYGNAFSITFTGRNGEVHEVTIAAQQPVSLAKAGYSDEYGLAWTPYLLSAKYFADADRKSMQSMNPELVLRLTKGNWEVARTALREGGSGMLGDYRVQLNGVRRWAKLVIVESRGMPLVFTGFAIIMLGGLMHYMTPPRELVGIRQRDGSYRVYWKALSFREFFVEERDEVAEALRKGSA